MEAVKKNCLKMLKKEKTKLKDQEILNINIVNTQDAAAFINLLKPYDYKIVKIIKKNDLFLAKINNHYHGGFVFYIALSSLDFKLKCFKRYVQDNLEDQKNLKMRNITFDFKLREEVNCGISETK